MKNEVVTQKQQEQGMQWLDVAYGQAIKGIGVSFHWFAVLIVFEYFKELDIVFNHLADLR